MEFFINKNATLPILKMELIQDGRNDFHNFFDLIQNANIFFSLTDVVTGVKRIGHKRTGVALVTPVSDCVGEEYYITYQFTANDTAKAGTYLGQFQIEFQDGTGTLIVPIRESLYVNILDNNVKK